MYTPRRAAALGAETQAGRPWRRRCVRIQRAPASYGHRAKPEVLHARHRDVQVSAPYSSWGRPVMTPHAQRYSRVYKLPLAGRGRAKAAGATDTKHVR